MALRQNSTMKSLSLSNLLSSTLGGNRIKTEGVKAIAEMLKCNKCLTSLDISKPSTKLRLQHDYFR
jgi:hypothetical protein